MLGKRDGKAYVRNQRLNASQVSHQLEPGGSGLDSNAHPHDGGDDVSDVVVCGPGPEAHLEAIESFADAGFDHVYVHQVGPNQEGFFEFYEREILPEAIDLMPRTLQAATA